MKGLPLNWALARVGDLIDLGPKNECTDDTEVGFVPLQRLGIEYRSRHTFEAKPWSAVKKGYTHFADGDVLLARITPSFENGKAGIVRGLPNGIGAGSTEYFVCRPLMGAVLPEYLLAHFKTSAFIHDGDQVMSGAVGQQRVPKQYLLDSTIRLAPFSEQKRITDKIEGVLERVDACRERLDRVPAILKRFRQAVLATATSGKLTEDWREVNSKKSNATQLAEKIHRSHVTAGGHKVGNAAPPTEDVHNLSLDMFPKGWALLTLRDLVLPDRPITYGILKPGPELEEGIPYIRVADFPGERLNLTSIRKTSPKIDEEFKRSRLRAGDILLSIRGTVGRLIVVPEELEEANITQDSARLSIQPDANRDYVLWYLRSELAQSRMRGAIKGVAVRGINIGDVRALQVPLPSRNEQDEIVRRVETLLGYADRLEVRYSSALAKVERLTPALLAKAFRGELVPQDPNDEPASVLLKRIRDARETASAKPKKGNSRSEQSRAVEVQMLNRKEIHPTHLTKILKERGPLTAEALWSASQLDIDDFYDQLKDEEARGLLKEQRGDSSSGQRLLEAA